MNVTTETFERDVIERSREVPVIVDFWAAWCGPCRALGPAIEAEVAKRAGKIELAKIDVDAEQTARRPLPHPEHPDGRRLRRWRGRNRLRRRAPRNRNRQVPRRHDRGACEGGRGGMRVTYRERIWS